jgi:hypothetical protein
MSSDTGIESLEMLAPHSLAGHCSANILELTLVRDRIEFLHLVRLDCGKAQRI